MNLARIGLVAHPRRELQPALATVRAWAQHQGSELVQVEAPGQEQDVAPPGRAEDCDLLIALGGDGTALAALHASGSTSPPVLGVACGSLGALSAVTAERLEAALDRVAAGDWEPRRLPAVTVERDGGELWAINDLVLVRAGAGQVTVEVRVDGERFIRFGGDGLVAATPLGSTAYTLAAGGPMLAPGAAGLVLTPLAPHGGVCPPLVTTPGHRVEAILDAPHSGARVEIDGQVVDELEPLRPATFTLRFVPDRATLVYLGEHESLIAGLRRRRILLDSARVLARDDRAAQR